MHSYNIEAGDTVPPHDYLDDLESFFYVLCELMFTRFSPGKVIHKEAKLLLERWEARDPRIAIESKTVFLVESFDVDLIDSDYWGSACLAVLQGFHSFIYDIYRQKATIRRKKIPIQDKVALYKGLGQNGKIDMHYKTLEDLFNAALKVLETDGLKSDESRVTAEAELATTSGSSSRSVCGSRSKTSKRDSRKLDGAEDMEPPVKRRATRNVRDALSIRNETLETE